MAIRPFGETHGFCFWLSTTNYLMAGPEYSL